MVSALSSISHILIRFMSAPTITINYFFFFHKFSLMNSSSFCFSLQAKNHTNVRGMDANGDSHEVMSLHATTENTPEPNHSSVVIVIDVFRVQII